MKIIEGIDSALIYISKYLKDDKSKLESNGNGLFEENYPPELFARNIIKIIKEQGDYGLKRITNHLEQNENISFRVSDNDRKKSLKNLDNKLRKALEISIDRVKKFPKEDCNKIFKISISFLSLVLFKTNFIFCPGVIPDSCFFLIFSTTKLISFCFTLNFFNIDSIVSLF